MLRAESGHRQAQLSEWDIWRFLSVRYGGTDFSFGGGSVPAVRNRTRRGTCSLRSGTVQVKNAKWQGDKTLVRKLGDRKMIQDASEQCFVNNYMDSGDSCVLVMMGYEISIEMHKRVKRLYRTLEQRQIPGVVEVVPAYCSISVYYDPITISKADVVSWIEETSDVVNTSAAEDDVRQLYIPVWFGGEYGPDLSRVAAYSDMSPQAVIDLFCSVDFMNYFLGFMPGKPYLGGLPDVLETPRLEVPRFRVEPGTIVIFGKQVGLFGIEQPSGSNCIGRSPVPIFDKRLEDPVVLRMGDLIRFYPIDEKEFLRISDEVESMTYQIRTEYQKG